MKQFKFFIYLFCFFLSFFLFLGCSEKINSQKIDFIFPQKSDIQHIVTTITSDSLLLSNNYDSLGSFVKKRYFDHIILCLDSTVSSNYYGKNTYYSGYYLIDPVNTNKTTEEKIIASKFFNIDRSSENLQHLYNTYAWFIFSLVSTDAFEKLKINETITDLMVIYDHIVSLPNYKETLLNIRENIDSSYNTDLYRRPDVYGYNIHSQTTLYAEIISGDIQTNASTIWLYSFWQRRAFEDNMEMVFQLLKNIKKQYDEPL